VFEQEGRNRMFRLCVDGGDGADRVSVTASTMGDSDLGATFAYDIALQGGSSNDSISFVGSNPLASDPNGPTFGPAGFVLIDGGPGFDRCMVAGNFPVHRQNCET
jgi:hypothetical protein